MRLTTFQLAIRNLLLHKLRSLLTMLGTILGVGSVIAMLAIGEGSKQEAIEQIRQLGATNVIVRSVKPGTEGQEAENSSNQQSRSWISVLSYGLTDRDYERLTGAIPLVERAVPVALVRREVRAGRERIINARILGTTPDYQHVKSLVVDRGRFISKLDLERISNAVVLGAGAARRLFGYVDPIDKAVILGEAAYQVVGVLAPTDSGNATPGGVGRDDFNNDIYIPLAAARSRFGELQPTASGQGREFERVEISEITLTVHSETDVGHVAEMARSLLRRRHAEGVDFEIQVPLELLQQAEKEKRIWNIVLGSIAGISLLVGGIGIMNIMLATITERTREIGIRRALGAKRRDITIQFLVETVVLSSTGGFVGIFLGVTIPMVVTLALDIRTALSWWPVLLSFAISVGIGVVFGLYPARRAAQMDPIEALRHE